MSSPKTGMPASVGRRVGYLLKRAQKGLRIRMDEVLRPHGITAPQYAVLSAIEAAPGLSNAALARAAFVTPQTMQGIVANMERDGLLRRHQDPEHGRILKTELTAKARKLLGAAHSAVDGIEGAMLVGLGEAELAALADMLERCAENLGR